MVHYEPRLHSTEIDFYADKCLRPKVLNDCILQKSKMNYSRYMFQFTKKSRFLLCIIFHLSYVMKVFVRYGTESFEVPLHNKKQFFLSSLRLSVIFFI